MSSRLVVNEKYEESVRYYNSNLGIIFTKRVEMSINNVISKKDEAKTTEELPSNYLRDSIYHPFKSLVFLRITIIG